VNVSSPERPVRARRPLSAIYVFCWQFGCLPHGKLDGMAG
jgi:hypothetical protein